MKADETKDGQGAGDDPVTAFNNEYALPLAKPICEAFGRIIKSADFDDLQRFHLLFVETANEIEKMMKQCKVVILPDKGKMH